jgi:hypothetical protein
MSIINNKYQVTHLFTVEVEVQSSAIAEALFSDRIKNLTDSGGKVIRTQVAVELIAEPKKEELKMD